MTESTDKLSKARSELIRPGDARKSRKTKRPPANPVEYKLDEQPGFLIRVVLQRHTGFFNELMEEKLTAPQFSTLAKLYELGTCSQNYLGRLISYDSATITGVIERLRARGLISSKEDPVDRRRRALALTLEGRRVAELAIARVAEVSRQTFAPLTSDERATLTHLLQKILSTDEDLENHTHDVA